MAIPRQIQAQLDQAEAALQAANAPATPPEAPVVEQPEQNVEQQPEPATPPAPEVQPQSKPDTWEHKYKSLQGRYNHDVPNLQKQVQSLQTQLQDALARMEEVTKAAKPEPAESKPTADPQDVEAFGADLVGMVQRVAERMFGTAARSIQEQAVKFEQRLAQVEKALQGTTQTVAVTAEQAFFDRLAKLVPDWEAVNTNQDFLDWLMEVDPIYGQPRQAALAAAQGQLNAERAAAVFQAFKNTMPQAPVTKPNAVEKQVTPRATAASAAPAPTEKPVYTQKQVQDFYRDLTRGVFKGREAEAQRIEAQINAAMAEGRIR